MFSYIYKRLKEPSTWRGVILILTALGAKLTPEQASTIVTAGLAIVGAIGAFIPDNIGNAGGQK